MRVLLKLTLDSEPDAVWAHLHSPATFAQVMSPLMTATSTAPDGFPTEWSSGEHVIQLRLFGLFPLGTQSVRLSSRVGAATGINILRDTGVGQSGMLKLLSGWDHRMAISPLEDGRTLYRDQLRVRAGVLTPIVWPSLWLFWQWRAARLRRLAADW